MIFSYLLLGESPLPQELLGGSLALIGVIMVNTWGKSTRSVAEPRLTASRN